MKKIFLAACVLAGMHAQGQNTFPASGSAGIGTTTPNASALLEMVSTTKGLLIPRMTKNQRDAIASPATGLMIFQTNSTPGFYYYDGGSWKAVTAKGANATLSNLNAPTAINQSLLPYAENTIDIGAPEYSMRNIHILGGIYLGESRIINLNGNNSALGYGTLHDLSIGFGNTATGNSALYSITDGNYNTATGHYTLKSNTLGTGNTSTGAFALQYNTTGNANTATGYSSLKANTTGFNNTAYGYMSLLTNTTGNYNTALGMATLGYNTTGTYNSATGDSALAYNTTGLYNTAFGKNALLNNTTGNKNVAIGTNALHSSVNNSYNIAIGDEALYDYNDGAWDDFIVAVGNQSLRSNTVGYYNTAVGGGSLQSNTSGFDNTAVGRNALLSVTTGNSNTAIGSGANMSNGTLSNVTLLGCLSTATASNTVQLGNTAVTSVKAGNNITIVSDGRFKKNIKENVPGLSFVNALKPVTYNYDIHSLNNFIAPEKTNAQNRSSNTNKNFEDAINKKEKIVYTGFVAQDVEKAAEKFNYDFSGVYKPQNEKDPYGLSYADFVVPLVKAVQELSKQNEDQKKVNDDLQKQIAELRGMLSKSSDKENHAGNTSFHISLSPNPVNTASTLYIHDNNGKVHVTISDMSGKQLWQSLNITTSQISLPVQHFAAGTYVVTVSDGISKNSVKLIKK